MGNKSSLHRKYPPSTETPDIGVLSSYNIEPVLRDCFSYCKLPCAWPPESACDPAVVTDPMNIFEWEGPAYDEDYITTITEAAARLRNLVAGGQNPL